MTPARKNRADIQALRAIAVLLVVVNHIWAVRLPGGYVGVDVFFVISGFLITAHLLGEVARSGRVSLSAFYARRARRLLPAALVVALVSIAASLVWLPADRWERIGRETFGASAYFLNWLLAASSVDYSAQTEAATPVQHYWSLSVEEQFYLLWPLTLIAIVWAIGRRRCRLDPAIGMSATVLGSRRGLAAALFAIGIASFAFSVVTTEAARSAAYFNTFGRVWEFALGGLLAVLAPALTRRFAKAKDELGTVRGISQLLGYAAIGWAALTFDTQTAFPGPWALLPAAGTALVIAAGPNTPRWSPARLLAWRPIQYTGDISYSLYLCHWPVIVITPFVFSRELHVVDRLAIVALSFGLAALTKHFVEDPGRGGLLASARPRASLVAAACSIAVVAALVPGLGVLARADAARQAETLQAFISSPCFGAGALDPGLDCDGDPFGPAVVPPSADYSNAPGGGDAQRACGPAPAERQILVDGEPSLIECDFSRTGEASLHVWLVGDSHSEHWRGAVYDIARGNGWHVSTTMRGGCPSLPVPLTTILGAPVTPEMPQGCLDWGAQMSEQLLLSSPDLVLVSNFSASKEVNDGTGRSQIDQLASAAVERFGSWAAAGASVVVIRDVPTAGTELGPECVLLSADVPRGCLAQITQVLPPDPQAEAVRSLAMPGVHTVDLSDRFCAEGVCSGVIGGLPVYFDANHMARSYAQTAAPALGARLSETLGLPLRPPVQETTQTL